MKKMSWIFYEKSKKLPEGHNYSPYNDFKLQVQAFSADVIFNKDF